MKNLRFIQFSGEIRDFFCQILMKKHQFRDELLKKISNEIFYLIKVNYLF